MGLIFIAFLLFLFAGGLGFGKPNNDFLSRDMTTTINGYFLTTVFMTHIIQYISAAQYHPIDQWYLQVNRFLGQLIVAMFLFYSGYGVMESIKYKEDYIKSFPRKRLLAFALDFWIAAIIYLFISCGTGHPPTLRYAIEAFFAWESLGNSNWYVFAIMYLYFATYFTFRFLPKKYEKCSIFIVLFLSLCYIFFMERHKGGWWYDTILCYVAGMFFSATITQFRKFMATRKASYSFVLSLAFAGFVIAYLFKPHNVWRFEVLSICFAILVVLITMKMKANNPIYSYIGKNLFPFYIYQRIPMILLKDNLCQYNIYLYFLTCVVITVAICMIMIPFQRKLHQWIGVS